MVFFPSFFFYIRGSARARPYTRFYFSFTSVESARALFRSLLRPPHRGVCTAPPPHTHCDIYMRVERKMLTRSAPSIRSCFNGILSELTISRARAQVCVCVCERERRDVCGLLAVSVFFLRATEQSSTWASETLCRVAYRSGLSVTSARAFLPSLAIALTAPLVWMIGGSSYCERPNDAET